MVVRFELICDLKRKAPFAEAFFAKCLMLLFLLGRITSFIIWLISSIELYPIIDLASDIIFALSTDAAIGCAVVVLVFWCELLSKLKTLSNETQKKFKIVKKILTILVIFFGVVSVVFVVVSASGFVVDIISILTDGINVIYAFGCSVYGIFITVQMYKSLNVTNQEETTRSVARKNLALMICAIIYLSLVIVLAAFSSTNAPLYAWSYLSFHTVFRFQEISMMFFCFYVLERYMLSYGLTKGYWMVFSGLDVSEKSRQQSTYTFRGASSKNVLLAKF